ncbi:HlyD family secretion protein [Brevundimonas diminuta]|uniref:HlyD family secretion protein n=1 Tax=Brevundimonas diminuta TaxID=293 RepID=UPI003CFCF256
MPPAPRLSIALAALAFLSLPILSACQKAEPPAEAAPLHAIARGRIEVQGGLLALSAPIDGELRALDVVEGQKVRKGDVLARFDTVDLTDETRLIEAQANQSRQRHTAAQRKARGLSETVGRYEQAAKAGAASAQALAEARQSLADAQSEVDAAAAEIAVADQRLAQARNRLHRAQLIAPADGVALRVAASSGQRLSAGAPVLTLLPDRPLIVRAEINESFISRVRTGMKATVSVDPASSGAKPLPPARLTYLSPVYTHARQDDDVERGPSRVVEGLLEFDARPDVRVGQTVRIRFDD